MATSSIPEVDYPHLPGEEHDPLMESALHVRWSRTLQTAIIHTLGQMGSDAEVTGNVPFVPVPGEVHTAPDVMVVPHRRGENFGRYEVGVHGPAPLACIEIVSPSNSRPQIDRRVRRWLSCGVGEVYVLDPETEAIERVNIEGDGVRRVDARGAFSPALNLTFAMVDGRLKLCCPAGRLVGVDTDSYSWVVDEQRRADEEKARADEEKARADEEKARADALSDEVRRLTVELGRLRGEASAGTSGGDS